ncbi:phage head spike fiber domain-containing protein [Escherichia coli]
MRGLYVPGAPVLGNISAGGGGADLSDIDLTSQSLDSRIKYQCASSHAYYAADGTIQFAAPDVWPLEYRNGVAVGRHEPEPQRTNLFAYSDNLTAWVKNGDVTEITQNGPANPYGTPSYAVGVGATANSGVFIRSQVTTGETYTISITGRADDARVMLIGEAYLGGQPVRVNFKDKTSTLAAPFAYRFADITNGGWRRYAFTGASTGTGTPGFVVYSADAVAGSYSVALVQHESGAFATSPIVTNGVAATRAAALGFVPNPGLLATAARIYYTDGTTYDIEFNGAPRGAIPQASKDWGTRYIEGVSYAKGFSR